VVVQPFFITVTMYRRQQNAPELPERTRCAFQSEEHPGDVAIDKTVRHRAVVCLPPHAFLAHKLADLVSAQSAHPLERSGHTSDGGLILPYQAVGAAN
jgi:hypothetical protein